jgi:hypothetical protein
MKGGIIGQGVKATVEMTNLIDSDHQCIAFIISTTIATTV